MTKVVIVESPAKIKTIEKFLPSDYRVLASYGHIRDLPSKNGSVIPDNNFEMIWEIDEGSIRHISAIANETKNADELYLATDPDREGEAISWHILEILKDKKILKNQSVKRVVFHEITKPAILQAFKEPRHINQELVNAYLARRALDYLFGFTLSPILWRKLPGARSAGRVQSVALRLIVQREQEIEQFISQEYWSIEGTFLSKENKVFQGRLITFDGGKVEKLSIKSEKEAQHIHDILRGLSYTVKSCESKEVNRHPAPPFITSSLQQDASRKFGYSPSRTMQIAQKLYEGISVSGETVGLITYMRTDSVNLSNEAQTNFRSYIQKEYGNPYLPETPRFYKNKSKNAQEAHEGIRPTDITRHPKLVQSYLSEEQFKIYDLIWKRALASQMTSAKVKQVTLDIADESKKHEFRSTGSQIIFDGFLKLYQESTEDNINDKEQEDRLLPKLDVKDPVSLKDLDQEQHFTQPPPHYTEASLIQKMEELGIGRPSTYASILKVLQERDYVKLEKRQLLCQDKGRIVTAFLMNYFPKYVEYNFTADLEEQLDNISNGQEDWHKVLESFWSNFKKTTTETESLKISDILVQLEKDLSQFLFKDDKERSCPSCKEGQLSLKLGKFGAFLGCSRYPECGFTRPLKMDGQAAIPEAEEKEIGIDSETGKPILLKKGPYGYYLEWPNKETAKPSKKTKPVRVSINGLLTPSEITLEKATFLKSLPRQIGLHPETNLPITVNVGRFGPFIKYDDKFFSIGKAYNIFNVGIPEAIAIISKKLSSPPKKAVPRRKASPTKKTKK